MRPGQLTPENVMKKAKHSADVRASMRPGQLTPENASGPIACLPRGMRFNEAGAINPGKLLSISFILSSVVSLQ